MAGLDLVDVSADGRASCRLGAGGVAVVREELMLAAQRRSLILAELGRDGTVRVSDLVARLGVSDMTVRRDLQALHRQGLLEKVHGGAMAVAEPSTAEPGFEANSARRQLEKEAIAAAGRLAGAARFGDRRLGRHDDPRFRAHLVDIPDLTVVTNSVWVADLLHRSGRESMLRPASPAASAPPRTRSSVPSPSPR